MSLILLTKKVNAKLVMFLILKEKKKTNVNSGGDNRWQSVFAWQHYVMTAVAVVFIVVGFVLMLPEADVRNRPGGRFAPTPGPGAFDARRIRLAPIPCFVGFAMMPLVIMYVPRNRKRFDEMGKN